MADKNPDGGSTNSDKNNHDEPHHELQKYLDATDWSEAITDTARQSVTITGTDALPDITDEQIANYRNELDPEISALVTNEDIKNSIVSEQKILRNKNIAFKPFGSTLSKDAKKGDSEPQATVTPQEDSQENQESKESIPEKLEKYRATLPEESRYELTNQQLSEQIIADNAIAHTGKTNEQQKDSKPAASTSVPNAQGKTDQASKPSNIHEGKTTKSQEKSNLKPPPSK